MTPFEPLDFMTEIVKRTLRINQLLAENLIVLEHAEPLTRFSETLLEQIAPFVTIQKLAVKLLETSSDVSQALAQLGVLLDKRALSGLDGLKTRRRARLIGEKTGQHPPFPPVRQDNPGPVLRLLDYPQWLTSRHHLQDTVLIPWAGTQIQLQRIGDKRLTRHSDSLHDEQQPHHQQNNQTPRQATIHSKPS